jgi:hypothetical protein
MGMVGTDPLTKDIEGVINKHSAENLSNTPDFILANLMKGCLGLFSTCILSRDKWYGVRLEPGKSGEENFNALQHTKAEISGALARGYCTEANKHKTVDPVLMEAMLEEILKLSALC